MKENTSLYDMIVIGGGPAGYTAALYAARAGLSTLLIEKLAPGGQMALTSQIDNYPGFHEGVDGFNLGMQMKAGAERFGAKTKSASVLSVKLQAQIKEVQTDEETLQAKTVVIATGAAPRQLGVDREKELTGKGLHYCAHCDGMFYRGKEVVVVGGGNSAVADALYLSRIAKKVTLVHRRDSLRATKIYHQALMDAKNVEFLWNSAVTELQGEDRLSGAVVKNLQKGEETAIACDAVFVSIGRDPTSQLVKDQLSLDENGYIIAGETTETNLPGVYAAGDVRTKALRQIVTATADGAVAAHYAEQYLSH